MKKVLFLIFCVSIFSCSDDKKEDIFEEKILTLDKTEINIKGEGGHRLLKITSNIDWTISGVPDWCEVYTLYKNSEGKDLVPTLRGSADADIVIKIRENASFENKQAILKLSGDTNIDCILQINQEGRFSNDILTDPMKNYEVYPGLHFDADFYLNENAGFKPLYIGGYSELISISADPAIIEPLKGDPWVGSISDYVNSIDRDKINNIPAKTIITVSELRASEDFMEKGMTIGGKRYIVPNTYARVVIDFKKPLLNLEMSPIVVDDENIKQEILSKSKTPLYISSVMYGYRKSFVFGVDVDQVETVVRQINDYIENGDYAMVESYVISLSSSYFGTSGISIPFSLKELIKSAQSESLFEANSQIVSISWRAKRAISNEPF